MRGILWTCGLLAAAGCEPDELASAPPDEPAPDEPVVAPQDSCAAAAKVGEPVVAQSGGPFQVVFGMQGGTHVDVGLWLSGLALGAPTVPGYNAEELGWPLLSYELYPDGGEPAGYPNLLYVRAEGSALEARAEVRVYDVYSDDVRLLVRVEDACGNVAELDELLELDR